MDEWMGVKKGMGMSSDSFPQSSHLNSQFLSGSGRFSRLSSLHASCEGALVHEGRMHEDR